MASKYYFQLTISSETEKIAKGLAIFLIVLHNFCHLCPGTIDGNEASFFAQFPKIFLQRLQCFHSNIVYDSFSFLGWYGVSIFFFFSGYGLVKKYESEDAPILRPGEFFVSHWCKFFRMILPAVTFLVVFLLLRVVIVGVDITPIFRFVSTPTFINDLIYPILPPDPGAYWYLGAALEFYVFYALIVYKRSSSWLIIAAIFSLALQYALIPSEGTALSHMATVWLRKNFIGWICSFALGVLWARGRYIRRWVAVAFAIASFILFFPSMFNEFTWHFSPLFAIIITLVIARGSVAIPKWSRIWIWMGALSGFIYVVHPIVRHLVFVGFQTYGIPVSGYLPYILPVYVILSILAALLYRRLFSGFIK